MCIRDRYDNEGRSKGYAFCEFPSRQLAEAAIRNLNGNILKKREVRVSYTSASEPGRWPEQTQAYINKAKKMFIDSLKTNQGF